jgi:prefoldin beta subunit
MEETESQKKIAQLQMLQQNLQQLLGQKQQFQMQFNEAESALVELKDAKKAYKVMGNLMILSSREKLEKQLDERKKTVELRIKSIESQEDRLRKKADDLQKDVVNDMGKK